MFNKNLVKNLPDAYKKTAESNNFKILEIERIACDDLRKTLQDINNILDINNAKGKTLDLYGERVGQARGVATDEKYLLLIKSKILQNLSVGSIPSITNALCSMLECEPSQVIIVDGEEPYTVNIVSLPLSIINTAGLTTSQTIAIVERMLPAGVSITSFVFEGTFMFASAENEYDEAAGFCNVEGGTIGGYLGATAGDETEEILPI